MENLYEWVCDKITGIENQTDTLGLSEDTTFVTQEEEKIFYEMRAYMLQLLRHVKVGLEFQNEDSK